MATYTIISQEPYQGKTKYKVSLTTSDGHSETQEYVGDTTTLDAAASYFQSAWNAAKSSDDTMIGNPPALNLKYASNQ